MLEHALNILDKMDDTDENVIALKSVLLSYANGTKLYMLKYKGEFVTFNMNTHNSDFSNGYTVYLSNDKTNNIWTTDDIRIASYVKYVSTPWFNSTIITPTHDFKPNDLEIVDNNGKIYNRKPLTYKTLAIIKSKIYNDNGYLKLINNKDINENDIFESVYEQINLLSEAKRVFLKKGGKYLWQ